MLIKKRVVLVLTVIAFTSGCSEKNADEQQPVLRSTAAATAPAAQVQAGHPIELFGVKLKGVSQNELNTVLLQNGLSKQSEKSDQWTDVYSVNGKLKGADTLTINYVSATHKFANAEYMFPSFMETQLVKQVIDLVSQKYGDASSMDGQIELGNVTAEWDNSDGMTIHVSRGWPSTTVYLDYTDPDAAALMRTEQDAAKHQNLQNAAKQQSQAF